MLNYYLNKDKTYRSNSEYWKLNRKLKKKKNKHRRRRNALNKKKNKGFRK